MPIYEFRCTECKQIFEVIVMSGTNDDEDIKCSHCGAESFERVLSSGSVSDGSGGNTGSGSSVKERSCSSGSCTTYTIPGPA